MVPESAMESVGRTLANVKDMQTHLKDFLSLCDPQVIAQLPPLQRAQAHLTFAKATTTLFALNLRCKGVNPDDHPIKSELERLRLYEDKLERLMESNKEPLRPSTILNHQAATRFIEHSLPDLTPEQKQSMREISRGEGPKIKHSERSGQKKRKYSSDKQSIQNAAQAFLEKAARELLGDNKDGFKGPLQVNSSDEDDKPDN